MQFRILRNAECSSSQAFAFLDGKDRKNTKSILWPLSSAEVQRFFSPGGVDLLSNVSAGTELQATVESAGASARYHTQDGCHPGETIFCVLLPGVACIPCVTVQMAGKILRFSDV